MDKRCNRLDTILYVSIESGRRNYNVMKKKIDPKIKEFLSRNGKKSAELKKKSGFDYHAFGRASWESRIAKEGIEAIRKKQSEAGKKSAAKRRELKQKKEAGMIKTINKFLSGS